MFLIMHLRLLIINLFIFGILSAQTVVSDGCDLPLDNIWVDENEIWYNFSEDLSQLDGAAANVVGTFQFVGGSAVSGANGDIGTVLGSLVSTVDGLFTITLAGVDFGFTLSFSYEKLELSFIIPKLSIFTTTESCSPY